MFASCVFDKTQTLTRSQTYSKAQSWQKLGNIYLLTLEIVALRWGYWDILFFSKKRKNYFTLYFSRVQVNQCIQNTCQESCFELNFDFLFLYRIYCQGLKTLSYKITLCQIGQRGRPVSWRSPSQEDQNGRPSQGDEVHKSSAY